MSLTVLLGISVLPCWQAPWRDRTHGSVSAQCLSHVASVALAGKDVSSLAASPTVLSELTVATPLPDPLPSQTGKGCSRY